MRDCDLLMTKPDFSGTWKFNPSRSSLQIPSPESSVFVIEHNEPHFHLERTHVVGGNGDTLSIDLMTNGEVVILNRRGIEMHVSLHWEETALVFDCRFDWEGEPATNIVRYSITDEGRTFMAAEQLRGKQHSHDNVWVFDRQ